MRVSSRPRAGRSGWGGRGRFVAGGGVAAHLVRERALERRGVHLHDELELGADHGGDVEGRELGGGGGGVAPVVRLVRRSRRDPGVATPRRSDAPGRGVRASERPRASAREVTRGARGRARARSRTERPRRARGVAARRRRHRGGGALRKKDASRASSEKAERNLAPRGALPARGDDPANARGAREARGPGGGDSRHARPERDARSGTRSRRAGRATDKGARVTCAARLVRSVKTPTLFGGADNNAGAPRGRSDGRFLS